MRSVVLGLSLLLVSCGKVGDPLAPFIRIPESVSDLAAVQSGYDVILTWTNPLRNIDGSAATDLEHVRVLSDGAPVTSLDVSAGGKKQSYTVSVRPLTGSPRRFAVQVETTAQKLSGISNTVSITPVEVPGSVTALRAIVDQHRITLEWDLPRDNPDLANAYIVTKTGDVRATEGPAVVTERRFQDGGYEAGKIYAYGISAVRRVGQDLIVGVGSESIKVVATDKTPPQVPAGLEIVASDEGAFLTWMTNSENDLAGYRVYRSDRADAGFMPLTKDIRTVSAFFDSGYRAGLYYAVSAVDEFGNESAMSAPYHAP